MTDSQNPVQTPIETDESNQAVTPKAEEANKPAEGLSGDAPKAEGKDAAEAPVVEYEGFKIPDMPEGIQIDEKLLSSYTDWAKSNGIPQDKAELMAEQYSKHQIAQQQELLAAHQQQIEKWLEESKASQDIGGPGGKDFESNMVVANKAASQFFDKEFFELITDYGLSKHPAVLRGFVKLGKAVSEDNLNPSSVSSGEDDPAKLLYGKTTK